MSDADGLQAIDDGGVRTITIDRPESKNALTFAMRARMCELFAEAEQDPGTTAVILTGVDPVFSAGVDFKEMSQPGTMWNPYTAQFALNPGRALRALATPVICAVNGPCVGPEPVEHAAGVTVECRAD
jgi:enoyl-CoA hydratase